VSGTLTEAERQQRVEAAKARWRKWRERGAAAVGAGLGAWGGAELAGRAVEIGAQAGLEGGRSQASAALAVAERRVRRHARKAGRQIENAAYEWPMGAYYRFSGRAQRLAQKDAARLSGIHPSATRATRRQPRREHSEADLARRADILTGRSPELPSGRDYARTRARLKEVAALEELVARWPQQATAEELRRFQSAKGPSDALHRARLRAAAALPKTKLTLERTGTGIRPGRSPTPALEARLADARAKADSATEVRLRAGELYRNPPDPKRWKIAGEDRRPYPQRSLGPAEQRLWQDRPFEVGGPPPKQRRTRAWPTRADFETLREEVRASVRQRHAAFASAERARGAGKAEAARGAGAATAARWRRAAGKARSGAAAAGALGGGLLAYGLARAMRRKEPVEKLAKGLTEAQRQQRVEAAKARWAKARTATAAQRVREARARGERLVYRGAPTPDWQPTPRKYAGIFVTPSKGFARDYASPTAGRAGWITSYAMRNNLDLIDLGEAGREVTAREPDARGKRFIRRSQALLAAEIEHGDAAAKRRAMRRGLRGDDEVPESARYREGAAWSSHTLAFPHDAHNLRGLRADGTRLVNLEADAPSIMIGDGKLLRPLYARSAGSDRKVMLAKAAPDEPGKSAPERVAARTEKTLARRLASLFQAWGAKPNDTGRAEQVEEAIREAVRNAFEDMGGVIEREGGLQAPPTEQNPTIAFNFDMRTQRVEQGLREYAFGLVRAISNDSREAIRTAMLLGATTGATIPDQARLIRQSVGLSPGQVQWVHSFERQLRRLDPRALDRALRDRRFDPTIRRAIETGTPLSDEQVAKYVDAYRRRTLAYRATTIARTEGIRATNMASVAQAQAMIEADPTLDVEKTWITAGDERVRSSHQRLSGQVVVGMNTPFTTTGEDGQPVQIRWPHDPLAPASETVQCRCVLGLRIIRKPEAGTPLA
jgi:hypothetical protein